MRLITALIILFCIHFAYAGTCDRNQAAPYKLDDGSVCHDGRLYEDWDDYENRNGNVNENGLGHNGGTVTEPLRPLNINDVNSDNPACGASQPLRLTMLPSRETNGSDWFCEDSSKCSRTSGATRRSSMSAAQRPMASLFDNYGFVKSCYVKKDNSNMMAMKQRCPAMSDEDYDRVCPNEILGDWSRQGEQAIYMASPCGSGRECDEYIQPGFNFVRQKNVVWLHPGDTPSTAYVNTEPNSLDVFDINSLPKAKIAHFFATNRTGLPRRMSPVAYDGVHVFIPYEDKDCKIDNSGCGHDPVATSGKIKVGTGGLHNRIAKCKPDAMAEKNVLGRRDREQLEAWNAGGWQKFGICLTFINMGSVVDSDEILFASNRNKEAHDKMKANEYMHCRSADYGYTGTRYNVSEEECIASGEEELGGEKSPEPEDKVEIAGEPGDKCICGNYPQLVCYNDKPDGQFVRLYRCDEAGKIPTVALKEEVSCSYKIKINGEAKDCCQPGAQGYDGTDLGYVCQWMANHPDEFKNQYNNSSFEIKVGNHTTGATLTVTK